MKISTVLKFVLLPIFFPLVALRAQSVVYSGPLGSPTLQIKNSADNTFINFPVITAGQEIAVDATALTVLFQKFQIQTSSFTASKSLSITVGFGQSKDYTINLTFAASTFAVADATGTHSLAPASGGAYNVMGLGTSTGLVYSAVGSINLTGTYSVVGPTQTVSGSFNVPLNINADNTLVVPNSVNTNGYPSSLVFSNSSNSFHEYAGFGVGGSYVTNFVDATVDGQRVTWGFSTFDFQGQFGTVFPGYLSGSPVSSSGSSIPEPSTYAAIFGVTVLGFAVYRRRNKSF